MRTTLGLWTLEERRNRADLLEIFELIKGFTAVSWTRFFTRIDNVTTRHGPSQLSVLHLPLERFTARSEASCSESRFLLIPPAFDAPVRRVSVRILPCRFGTENVEWLGYPMAKK